MFIKLVQRLEDRRGVTNPRGEKIVPSTIKIFEAQEVEYEKVCVNSDEEMNEFVDNAMNRFGEVLVIGRRIEEIYPLEFIYINQLKYADEFRNVLFFGEAMYIMNDNGDTIESVWN